MFIFWGRMSEQGLLQGWIMEITPVRSTLQKGVILEEAPGDGAVFAGSVSSRAAAGSVGRRLIRCQPSNLAVSTRNPAGIGHIHNE